MWNISTPYLTSAELEYFAKRHEVKYQLYLVNILFAGIFQFAFFRQVYKAFPELVLSRHRNPIVRIFTAYFPIIATVIVCVNPAVSSMNDKYFDKQIDKFDLNRP